MKDYYGILGVREDATRAEIMQRYRQIINEDALTPPSAYTLDYASRLSDVNLAYSVLSNEAERRNYDQTRTTDDISWLTRLSQQATIAYHAGDLQGAIKHYSDAINLDPRNYVLLANRAVAHFGDKQFDKSAEDANEATTISPQCFNGHYILINSLYKLGKSSDAKKAFLHACNIFPNNDTLSKMQDMFHKEEPTKQPYLALPQFIMRPSSPPTNPRPPLDPQVG